MNFLVETWRNTIFPTSRFFFLEFYLVIHVFSTCMWQLFSFAKSCLLASSAKLQHRFGVWWIFFGFGVFQKSHPNFQDVNTSFFFLVWIFWSPKMGGFGVKPEGLASEPTPKLPKLPRFIMKPRRHPRVVKVNIFPQFWSRDIFEKH